jgi:hypothetical protein
MPQSQLKCVRCQGRMEIGVVVDRAHSGMPTRETWVQGIPKWSRWMGLTIKGLPKFPVVSYRCEKCGYLDSYANPEADA